MAGWSPTVENYILPLCGTFISGFTEDEWGEFEFAIQHGDNETALKILETVASSADA